MLCKVDRACRKDALKVVMLCAEGIVVFEGLYIEDILVLRAIVLCLFVKGIVLLTAIVPVYTTLPVLET